MARWAIGDLQGCCEELTQLLARIRFSDGRDRVWFVGDLVNRGPQSLQTLRLVRGLADNAISVLGNHDLHLLAVAMTGAKLRKSDTLSDILQAPDREQLLEWLQQLPLAHFDPEAGDLLVHAGVLPQWSVAQTLQLAAEVQQALREHPRALLSDMYDDQPDRWRAALAPAERLRLTINALTRLRFCTAEGRVDFRQKGRPESAPKPWLPWFRVPERASRDQRIVFGHWSALGYHSERGILGIDTGCVWGGALTAVNLDDPEAPPVSVPSRQLRSSGE
jgi:bis(5'-nucleosyl)-tetraphosphatase (symmetrical)